MMKCRRIIFIILVLLFIVVFCITFFYNKPINFNYITSVQITAINFDGETSTLSFDIKETEKFKDIDDFDRLSKTKRGYNFFQNSARWYITIQYNYENHRPITHAYSGDENFDIINKAVLALKDKVS